MTIKEAAAELGASAWTIRHLCQRGLFPAIKRRTAWYVPENFRKLMDKKLLASFEGIPTAAMKK